MRGLGTGATWWVRGLGTVVEVRVAAPEISCAYGGDFGHLGGRTIDSIGSWPRGGDLLAYRGDFGHMGSRAIDSIGSRPRGRCGDWSCDFEILLCVGVVLGCLGGRAIN